MLVNKKRHKITLTLLFLSIVYLSFCCFIFFFIANTAIDLIFDGKVILTRKVIIDIIVVSVIAGVAGGSGSWLFAKLDERKARKKPQADSH